MRKSTLFSIAVVVIIILALARFHYTKDHFTGNYYLESYFIFYHKLSFKTEDGKFIPVLKGSIPNIALVDSFLFVTEDNAGTSSYFIVDTRKDFREVNGQNVLGPIAKDVYLKLYSHREQLKNNWNSYR